MVFTHHGSRSFPQETTDVGQTAALVARDVGETLLCKADPPFQNVGRMGNDGDFL